MKTTKQLQYLAGLTLIALLVLAAACNRIPEKTEPVILGVDDNGEKVEVATGQEIVLRLPANPGTGYGWQMVQMDESLLKLLGDPQFENGAAGDEPVVGANGWEIFHLEPLSAGEAQLELGYKRAWENEAPLETFKIEVIVH